MSSISLPPLCASIAWRKLALAVALAAASWTAQAQVALANRFGPPWQAEVVPERTIAFSRPDRAAPPVGPLNQGSRVIVAEELKDADGTEWSRTDVGYLLSDDLNEIRQPWVAEVVAPSLSIYAKPGPSGGIRRTARTGELLRVTGMSAGLDGNNEIWWATTEGFVALGQIQPADSEAARGWTVPDGSEAPNGWWASLRSEANVRASASTNAPIVGKLVPGDRVKILAEEQGPSVNGSTLWYRIDGGRFAGGRIHSSLVSKMPDPKPNTTAPSGTQADTWLVVDRKATSLTLVKDGQPQFVTYASLGRAGVETPTGFYSTLGKYKTDDMTSSSVADADHTYDLPNVPFTQYYRLGGFAIHGAYWHDHYGLVESQGCVNVTWGDSAYLFNQTVPRVAPEDVARWIDADQATPVVILD